MILNCLFWVFLKQKNFFEFFRSTKEKESKKEKKGEDKKEEDDNKDGEEEEEMEGKNKIINGVEVPETVQDQADLTKPEDDPLYAPV